MPPEPEISASRAAQYRPVALIVLGVFAVAAGALALFDPRYAQLSGYALYAVAAHLLISVLLHEPALFYAAKIYPAVLVAIVGTLATMVAIVVDYWLIGWLVNHHLVKPLVTESRWFQFAQRWFRKAPFLLIAGSALAPVPFYPVKILAIASDYSLARFIGALLIGRLPRFYVLAKIGGEVDARTSTLGWITLALAAFGGWRIWRSSRQRISTTVPGEPRSPR
jgi:membrane protein YqaA with SNARE-associated domain